MGFVDILVPTLIICAAIGLLYAKVSYVRQFVSWVVGKMSNKKEEIAERVSDSGNYQLAFRYGS